MGLKCGVCGRDMIQLFSSLACPEKNCTKPDNRCQAQSGVSRCKREAGHALPHVSENGNFMHIWGGVMATLD